MPALFAIQAVSSRMTDEIQRGNWKVPRPFYDPGRQYLPALCTASTRAAQPLLHKLLVEILEVAPRIGPFMQYKSFFFFFFFFFIGLRIILVKTEPALVHKILHLVHLIVINLECCEYYPDYLPMYTPSLGYLEEQDR